jgi:hypothetical protein
MDFRFDVCVVEGCGHVGLPLALTFAHRGLKVGVYDIDDRAVNLVRAGRMPFLERGAEPILLVAAAIIGEIALFHKRAYSLLAEINLSTTRSTTVLELAELIWRKVHGDVPLRYVSDASYPYDVRRRVPSVEKAKRIQGFEATTPLSEALNEIIPWVRQQIEIGGI